MSIHLSGPPHRPPEPQLVPDLPAPGARVRSSLGSGRPCPFLGSEDGAGLANNSPSRSNVCHARPRKEWEGMHRVTIPYSRVSREKQTEVCFAAFNQCPYRAQGAKLMEEHKRQLQEQAHHKTDDAAPRHKKRRPAKQGSARMSGRTRAIVRYGGLGLGAAACALIVSLVISAEPGRMFDFLFEYITLQNIKSIGLGDKGLDKSDVTGLAAGGNLRASQLKNMSAAQKEQLKAKFSGMSEAEKQKLKEKYKAMMGR